MGIYYKSAAQLHECNLRVSEHNPEIYLALTFIFNWWTRRNVQMIQVVRRLLK